MPASIPPYPGSRVKGSESRVGVAALQMEPHIGDKDQNVAVSVELIGQAAKQGAQLMVLPELCNTGYVFNSREEVAWLAESVPDGPTCKAWEAAAKNHKVYLVAGITEQEGGRFYNSAVLIGPDGYLGKYRKNHLWDEEKLFFEPGDLGYPIFHLPFGRVGILICYDAWHPESILILALRGADIICDPTCWVVVPDVIGTENPISPGLHAAQAHMSGVFVVCADRVGTERDVQFLGHSCIAGPNGYVAGPASLDRQEVLTAEINLVSARYRHWTDLADPLKDRRIDLYDQHLGYKHPSS